MLNKSVDSIFFLFSKISTKKGSHSASESNINMRKKLIKIRVIKPVDLQWKIFYCQV